jgi:hypothetical protein
VRATRGAFSAVGAARISTLGVRTPASPSSSGRWWSNPNSNPVTLLVARASGLPIYHTYAGFGTRGFVWVYGNAVREPASVIARRS